MGAEHLDHVCGREIAHLLRGLIGATVQVSGASSIFYGDRLLTTLNPKEYEDRDLLETLDLAPLSPYLPAGVLVALL